MFSAAPTALTPVPLAAKPRFPAHDLYRKRRSEPVTLARCLRWGTSCKEDGVGYRNSLPFLYRDCLVGLNVWYNVLVPGGPQNSKAPSSALVRLAQHEGHRQLALRQIGGPGLPHT